MNDEKSGNKTAEESTQAAAAGVEPDELIEPLRRENENLRGLLRLSNARHAMISELQKAGARSPGLLFAHAVDDLQFDDEGQVKNALAAVEKLRRVYPEQFGRDLPPSIDGGVTGGRTEAALTKEALSKMRPSDVAELDWAEVRRILAEG